jgi:hypothetical protein
MKLKNALAFVGLSLAASCVTTPLVAQSIYCNPAEVVSERLESEYGELPVSVGLDKNENISRMYVNETTGTWSYVRTLPNGISCLLDSGTHFSWWASDDSSGDGI